MGQTVPKSLHCPAFCETDALSSVTSLGYKEGVGTDSNRGNRSSSLSEWAHTGCPESKLSHISFGPPQARKQHAPLPGRRQKRLQSQGICLESGSSCIAEPGPRPGLSALTHQTMKSPRDEGYIKKGQAPNSLPPHFLP